MLTLNDGRSELWQWDTGRTLAVDADCSQVHFSNKVFGRSIDVDVVNGAAIIPDVLLQTDKDLNVWAFVGTAENGYTKISKTFKVNRRNKPSDYVFTPTEQTTLAELVEQIGNLGELTTEAKDNLVAAINEAAQSGGGSGASVELDTTLTQSGKAADAKAVGDALAEKQPKGDYLTQNELPDMTAYRTAEAQDVIDAGKQDTLIQSGATVGQIAKITAVDDTGKPTAWEAADMEASVDIDISRAPDLIIEVSEAVVQLSVSEINGVPINTTEMVVLWEHPSGGAYIPSYFRFNNSVINGTGTAATLANWNFKSELCPTVNNAAAILARVKKVNNGVYYYEFSGLQQNAGTTTGSINTVYGAPYSNILDGETSIKEFFVHQATKIQPGCKVSVWVK